MDVQLAQQKVFSVTEITGIIKEILEQTLSYITIEGEISNYKPSSAGHVYFTLKDSNAQISAVMFKSAACKLNFSPKDGDNVRCSGNITVYAQRGNYQIIVTKMEKAGAGNILQMLEERKQKLNAEGLFDPANKKSIPQFPKKIGIVTSPTGAALRDIIQITKRRNRSIDLIVLPAIVQGLEAAGTIVKMIEIANHYELCDVLIVGRGGGSLEDLLPFSDEAVVRAIANSKIPTISAVGHQIDWALCDYAADVRAATPSAAAELAVPVLTDITMQIEDNKNELYSSLCRQIENKRLLIKSFNPGSLKGYFNSIYLPVLDRFSKAKDDLSNNLTNKIKDLKNTLNTCITILENSSPQVIFNRGYSMVQIKATKKVVRSAQDVKAGDEIQITPASGTITATVNNTNK